MAVQKEVKHVSQKKLLSTAEIGKRLKILRGGRSQAEISAATGIGISALNNYEAGLRVPRDEAKAALAQFYHMSVDDIFFTD